MPRVPAKTPAAARSRRSAGRARRRPHVPRHIEIRQRQLQATLSATLKQARKRAGMTQVEVAEAIGTHPEVYGRMERGAVMPSVPTLLRLCLTLGSGPHELMGFSELEPLQSAPGASTVPHGLNDTPEKRRLLRRLARLDSPRIKALSRLVVLLLDGWVRY
jgi:transcriptional regulator with XRE-family HTH domain